MYGYLFNNYYLRDTNNKKRTLLKKPYHPHTALTPITILTSHRMRIK